MKMLPIVAAFALAGLTLGASAEDGDASEVRLPNFNSVEEQLEEAMRIFFQSDLANMTPQGPVEDTPLAEAVRLFRPLAEAGCAQAQYMLGSIQWGTQTQQAVDWGRRAAEHGHAGGQDMIGYAYSTGNRSIDYPANAHEEGIRWYRRAAEQGHTDAMGELAYKYWHGLGVERDLVRYYKWIALIIPRLPPIDPNHEQGRVLDREHHHEVLAALEERMSDEAIERARRLVREWEDEHDRIRHFPEDAEPPYRFWYRRIEGGCDR